MKSGIEMMLESMGIQTGAIKQLLDPENVKRLLQKVEMMCSSVDEIKASVQRIEIKLGTLPPDVAMNLLSDGQSQAFKDAAEFVREYNNGNSGNSNDRNGAGSDTGHGDGTTTGRGI